MASQITATTQATGTAHNASSSRNETKRARKTRDELADRARITRSVLDSQRVPGESVESASKRIWSELSKDLYFNTSRAFENYATSQSQYPMEILPRRFASAGKYKAFASRMADGSDTCLVDGDLLVDTDYLTEAGRAAGLNLVSDPSRGEKTLRKHLGKLRKRGCDEESIALSVMPTFSKDGRVACRATLSSQGGKIKTHMQSAPISLSDYKPEMSKTAAIAYEAHDWLKNPPTPSAEWSKNEDEAYERRMSRIDTAKSFKLASSLKEGKTSTWRAQSCLDEVRQLREERQSDASSSPVPSDDPASNNAIDGVDGDKSATTNASLFSKIRSLFSRTSAPTHSLVTAT